MPRGVYDRTADHTYAISMGLKGFVQSPTHKENQKRGMLEYHQNRKKVSRLNANQLTTNKESKNEAQHAERYAHQGD